MTDLTLSDLAGGDDSGGGSGGGGSDTAESGESLTELVEFLDDRGYLKPLMFGIDNTPTDDAPANDQPAATTESGDAALNATNIAALGQLVVEQMGDVPMSTVVQAAQSNPERINAAIDNLDIGDDDGDD